MIIHVKGDVIEVKGALVENHWIALRSAVGLLLGRHPSGVIIDGSGLTEINEAGAHTFIDAAAYIQAQHARAVVSGLPNDILNQIRQMPGARSQLPLAASVEEARASLAVGGAEEVPEAKRRPAILVPLLGDWQRAIEYAAHHADRKADIHLLYVMEIPRAMPLGVPLPEKEAEAIRILSEAESALNGTGITVRRMTTRARTGIEGAAKFAADTAPRLVVIAYRKDRIETDIVGQNVFSTLCDEPPGDTAVFCVEPETCSCKNTILVPILGAWTRAARFAECHALATRSEVHLLYVIQVSRILSIETSLPEAERDAEQALAEADGILKRSGLIVRKHTIRARDVLEGTAKFATEQNPRLVVVAHLKEDVVKMGASYGIIEVLCHDAPCDIGIYCAVPD